MIGTRYPVAVYDVDGAYRTTIERAARQTDNGPVIRWAGKDYPAAPSSIPGCHYSIQAGTALGERARDPIESMRADVLRLAGQAQILALAGARHGAELKTFHGLMKQAYEILGRVK